MNELQLFSYGSNTVRTVKLDGQIWFVVKDVCDILELGNPTEAIRALDDDEKNTLRVSEGNRGNPNVNIINEPGLYRLIFRSNKAEAKTFQDWVYHEVLPALHHAGSYTIGQEPASPTLCEDLKAVQLVLEPTGITGNQLSLALDKVYKSHTGRSALQVAGVQLVAPTKEQLLTPTDIGKVLGVLAQVVNSFLLAEGYQNKLPNGKYEPTEKGEPYAVMLDVGKIRSDGTPVRQLKWTSTVVDELSPNFN